MSEDSLYMIEDGGISGPEGLTVLRAPASGAAETAPHAVAAEDDAQPPYRGVVIIEWPPPGPSPYSAMPGTLVSLFDAATGKQIPTVTHVEVHAAVEGAVTADLTMLTGEDGEPLFEGMPVLDGDEIRTGTFPFVVAEMRVRGKGGE